MFKFTKYFSTKTTTQREPIPGSSQVPNSAGGYTWEIDDWGRLDRFLILGSQDGTFYVGERALTIENAEVLARCLAADGVRTIDRIVAISETGRAPKNDPAIFSLAMAAKLGDEATRRAAYAALPKVCRIGTHLMHFAEYAQGFGGWGRGMRKAVGAWFNAKPAADLAYQLAKYQSRDGWSNRDLLRLAHPRATSPSHNRLFA
jgi:60 kDa SS-A/Ro ribonucleoprotein